MCCRITDLASAFFMRQRNATLGKYYSTGYQYKVRTTIAITRRDCVCRKTHITYIFCSQQAPIIVPFLECDFTICTTFILKPITLVSSIKSIRSKGKLRKETEQMRCNMSCHKASVLNHAESTQNHMYKTKTRTSRTEARFGYEASQTCRP